MAHPAYTETPIAPRVDPGASMRPRIVFKAKVGASIEIRGSRILRVQATVLVAGGVPDMVLVLVRGATDIDTNDLGHGQLALTGAEMGVKSDEYSSRWPSVVLDYQDVGGLPIENEVCSLAMSSSLTASYTKGSATVHWLVWYVEREAT